HAAEVPSHHRDDVAETPAGQHLEHGGARSAGRLAVVARAAYGGVGPDHERRAVVARVPQAAARLVHDGARIILALGATQPAHEARSLALDLGGCHVGHGEVRGRHRPSIALGRAYAARSSSRSATYAAVSCQSATSTQVTPRAR